MAIILCKKIINSGIILVYYSFQTNQAMKKYFLLLCCSMSFILVEAQNVLIINTDVQINANNVPNNMINIPQQQVLATNSIPINQTNVTLNNDNNVNQQDFGTFTLGGGRSHSTGSGSTGISSGKHSLKLDLNLGKVHIARKFFHEFPLFKAKTYKKLFHSKKRSVKKCFKF